LNNITAKQILGTPRSDIWNLPLKEYCVTYDDSICLINTNKHIIFNRYCWDLFEMYPMTPIISSCNVTTILNGGSYNADTHIKMLEACFKHICEYNNINAYSDKEPLLRLVYRIINSIYNEIVNRVSNYVTTIDATDFVNIMKDEEIVAAHGSIRTNPESIDRCYRLLKTSLMNNKSSNRFVQAYKSKAINENQANQCLGPRGFVTDLDRTVFKQPITTGFIKGLTSLYDLMVESRTAAKSLNANDTHIKTSEYISRRLQLLAMPVERVINTDCGSTEYMDIFITKAILENLSGKYYLDEETNTLKHIKGDESHLIDKIIKMRTTLGCRLHNPHEVCTTCLGKVSENFRENSNLGYLMVAYLMEKVTQSILSTKHLTHSVKKSIIKLVGLADKYFYTDDDSNLYFREEIDLKGKYLILPNAKLGKLVDVLNLNHTNIALNKIGELEDIIIRDMKHKTPVSESINIAYNDRLCIITKSLLEYIKSVKLESDARGNFVIPLDNFNKKNPVFNNPLKEANIIAFVNKVARLIEVNKDNTDNPYDKLNALFMHIIDKFKCNISILEVLVYATTTFNSDRQNYKLGRNSLTPYCESKGVIFRHRSMGQLLVFEEQAKEIVSNASVAFSSINRQSHPMDVLFVPNHIVK